MTEPLRYDFRPPFTNTQPAWHEAAEACSDIGHDDTPPRVWDAYDWTCCASVIAALVVAVLYALGVIR